LDLRVLAKYYFGLTLTFKVAIYFSIGNLLLKKGKNTIIATIAKLEAQEE